MKRLLPLLGVAALALTLAACGGGGGGSSSPTTTSAASAVPNPIVFCTDETYPPEESVQGTKVVGSDIDIANAIAAHLGVKATFKNTVFDSIIAALTAKKCNAIISGMNDTAERRKQVDFTDYLKVGQSLMVKPGNPSHISSLAALSGHSVSVESGTTNRDFLAAESTKLTKAGKKAIDIKTFPKDTDAASALKAGRVDAYFGDSPVVVYYVKQSPSSFALGPSPINPIPIGIATRKGDPLRAQLQKSVVALYANGTIKHIVAKWGMSAAVTLLK